MRLIFSKDRPAQLDLLLTSLERNVEPEDTIVIWRDSAEQYRDGYVMLRQMWPDIRFWYERWTSFSHFETLVRTALDWGDEFTTLLCDDDVLYRDQPHFWRDWQHPEILCWSLRLGFNTGVCYPMGQPSPTPNLAMAGETGFTWKWRGLPPDFGYPGSLDGHIFRTADLTRMLDGQTFPNPTALECALVEGCLQLAYERPLMACYPHSVLVGVPVNRTSDQSNVRHGNDPAMTAEALNRRFLAGDRLDLDAIDFSGVNGAHTELELRWRERVAV